MKEAESEVFAILAWMRQHEQEVTDLKKQLQHYKTLCQETPSLNTNLMVRGVKDEMAEIARQRDSYREELTRFRNGYKGACYACETVGEKNVELEAKLAAAEDDAARYSKALTAIDEQLSETEEDAARYLKALTSCMSNNQRSNT